MISKTGCFMTYWENNRCLFELSKGLSADCSTNEPKKKTISTIFKRFFFKQRTSQFAIQKY